MTRSSYNLCHYLVANTEGSNPVINLIGIPEDLFLSLVCENWKGTSLKKTLTPERIMKCVLSTDSERKQREKE